PALGAACLAARTCANPGNAAALPLAEFASLSFPSLSALAIKGAAFIASLRAPTQPFMHNARQIVSASLFSLSASDLMLYRKSRRIASCLHAQRVQFLPGNLCPRLCPLLCSFFPLRFPNASSGTLAFRFGSQPCKI